MKYLLDTNVLSEVGKGERGDENVVAWYDSVERESLCLSVLVVGEIRAGIEKLKARRPQRAAGFERRLILVVDLFADRIIGIDRRIAERWGRLNVHERGPAVDRLMAATALVHHLTIVTRNVRDFEPTGAAVLNPFEPLRD